MIKDDHLLIMILLSAYYNSLILIPGSFKVNIATSLFENAKLFIVGIRTDVEKLS